jgi:hypothetical protein
METLPPHTPTPDAQKYIDSMTPDQKALHEMAIIGLGSSYFVERTKGYLEWLKTRTEVNPRYLANRQVPKLSTPSGGA